MGRPKIKLDVEAVEQLAHLGLNDAQISDALGISADTLRRRKQDSEAVEAALRRGRALAVAAVANALYDNALAGNVRAQIFFLKSRGGWRERVAPEQPTYDIQSVRQRLAEKLKRLAASRGAAIEQDSRGGTASGQAHET